MQIITKMGNGCKHEVGKVYVDLLDQDKIYYLCAEYRELNKCNGKPQYIFVDIEDGITAANYDTLEELDRENPDDVEVKCKLVVE
jgi:hypothetical protein